MKKIAKAFAKSVLKTIGLYNIAVRFLGNRTIRELAEKNGLDIKRVGHNSIIINKELRRSVIISSKHDAYTWDIMTDFDRWYSAVEPVIIGKMQVVDYSKPNIHTVRPYGVDLHYVSFVESMSMMEKEYFHRYKPQEGDVIFDCGAYCGDTAFIFSRLVGSSGRVYSFEPDPDNYAMLIKNVEKHNLQNVVPINKGISSHSKTVSFNSDGNLGASITNILTNCTCQIEAISLSDAYKNYGVSKIDFIKMDIEGSEIEAIKGAIDFLKNHNVNLAIANHIVNGDHTYITIEAILKKIGYEVETTNPSGNQTWSGLITYARKINK